MIKERTIRTIMPFVIVVLGAFFLSDANVLESFGDRLEMLHSNVRLLLLLVTGDATQMIGALICATVLFYAWKINKDKGLWFTDIYWQLSGVFFCIFLRSMVHLVGTFYMYLWVVGIVQLFKGIFLLYFSNTLWAARRMLYNPESSEESARKAAKFDELISFFKQEANGK